MQNKKIYLIGIKGVAMTALAQIYLQQGYIVEGSDTSDSFVTDDALSGIKIHHSFDANNVTADIGQVIYSGAYNQENNQEIKKAIELNLPIQSQQEALVEIVKNKDVIAVAGVGGKTTTTSMIAYVLERIMPDIGHFIGAGKISGLNGPGKNGENKLFVLEADEYANVAGVDQTPKLLLLNPKYAITTNIMHDHPDVYKSKDDTLATFTEFIDKLKDDGIAIMNSGDQLSKNIIPSIKKTVLTYGTENADYLISDIKYSDHHTVATIKHNNTRYSLKTSLMGDHNILNATATFALCHQLGLDIEEILDLISKFKGVGRRQELISEVNKVLFYDDYAHHPNEITLTIKAFKDRFPDKRLWVIFESHTFSRTKALFDDFIKSLSLADKVTIMPIFSSARENIHDFNFTGKDLSEGIKKLGTFCEYMTFEEAPDKIPSQISKNDIILTMGAGFVYKLHKNLIKNYEKFI